MNLIQAFEQNLVEGFENKFPDKVIETIISKLFFYGENVCKVYKYEKFFFGDFTSKDSRKEFYKEDFYWNYATAPDIHLALRPVDDDFFIEMKKFDDSKNLTNLLLTKQVSDEDIKNIVSEMISRLKMLTENKKNDSGYNFNQKLIDIHLADLESDQNLLYLIPSFVDKEWVDNTFDFLKKISINKYFLNYDYNSLSLLIDNHADNIVFFNNKVNFVDVLPPKQSWRIGDLAFCICRLAVDVAVLLSEDKAEIVYNSYNIPEEIKKIYEIRSALIQAWCFYSVKKMDIAKKYFNFAESRILWLKSNSV